MGSQIRQQGQLLSTKLVEAFSLEFYQIYQISVKHCLIKSLTTGLIHFYIIIVQLPVWLYMYCYLVRILISSFTLLFCLFYRYNKYSWRAQDKNLPRSNELCHGWSAVTVKLLYMEGFPRKWQSRLKVNDVICRRGLSAMRGIRCNP